MDWSLNKIRCVPYHKIGSMEMCVHVHLPETSQNTQIRSSQPRRTERHVNVCTRYYMELHEYIPTVIIRSIESSTISRTNWKTKDYFSQLNEEWVDGEKATYNKYLRQKSLPQIQVKPTDFFFLLEGTNRCGTKRIKLGLICRRWWRESFILRRFLARCNTFFDPMIISITLCDIKILLLIMLVLPPSHESCLKFI
jgi:hypothetical protein